jgi:lipopolysaccharide/colanic/teichoic acid biosynthesis glycosyltransferase
MYARYFKRLFDVILSLFALTAAFPVLMILTLVGAFAMGGNPFFTQERPGKNEKIFKLIKFRTMNNKKDKRGNLLPDEKRLTAYGKWLRSTSLDELPELYNILNGDMSIVGPRPLLVKYLPYYTKRQHHRHDVLPGLTGYAQTHGRNASTWDERFEYDLKYVKHITFIGDVKIIIDTVKTVLRRDGISAEGQATMCDFVDYVKEKRAAAREV